MHNALTNLTNSASDETMRQLDQLDQAKIRSKPKQIRKVNMAANPTPLSQAEPVKAMQVNLYEAKTKLSNLVDRAAKGEEFVIAKAGKPMARLVPIAAEPELPMRRRKFGQNTLGITFMSDDWEKDIPLEHFRDEGKRSPFDLGEMVVPPK